VLTDDQIGRILAGESAIRVIREHRGLSLRLLAKRTAIPLDYLKACEARKRTPSAGREQVIARELDLHPIALRPCGGLFQKLVQAHRA
jgi:hypothetical protein